MILGNLTPSECNTTITIANGGSLSGTLDTVDSELCAIEVDGWTAATLTFQGSVDNVTYFPISGNNAAGQLVMVPAASMVAANWIMLGNIVGMRDFLQLPRYLKFRSGTDAAPVAQGGLRTFICCLHPRHPWDLAQ